MAPLQQTQIQYYSIKGLHYMVVMPVIKRKALALAMVKTSRWLQDLVQVMTGPSMKRPLKIWPICK